MMQLQGKQKFKTGVHWLVWSGILAALSGGGWLVYAQTFNRSDKPVPVRLLTAERGNVEIVINESGTVELGGQQSIKSPGEVTVDQVLLKVGDPVRLGQKLLILRDREGQTNLANQELEIKKQELKLARSRQKVEEAQEKLTAIQKDIREPVNQQLLIRKQEIILARSRQKVEEAQAKLAAAQQKLQELKVLNEKGVIPGNELQDQQEQVRTAEANLRDAQSAVSTDTIELQRLQLEEKQPSELEDKVMAAQSELREARSAVNTDSRELQRLQVEQQNIQKQLQNNIVTAPISGMVLDINVKDGDGVKPGDVLLALGNPGQELIDLQLSTLDAAKVKVNQQARIKVIGPNPKPFYGRVKSIYPQAIASENEEGSRRQSSTQAKVPATVQLDRPSRTLIPGSQVSVDIILEQRQNVVTLDLTAIMRSSSDSFVWIQDDRGRAQKRIIAPGLEGATTAEIKSGLRPGDRVILPPPETPLQPGISVTPASN
jgi:HlyD family secretion protein